MVGWGTREDRNRDRQTHREAEKFIFLVKGFRCKGSHFSPRTFIQPFCVFTLFFFLWNHPGHAFQPKLLRASKHSIGYDSHSVECIAPVICSHT